MENPDRENEDITKEPNGNDDQKPKPEDGDDDDPSSEDEAEPKPKPIPAAQYVRMSTEHQQYSTENQSDMIQRVCRETWIQNRPHLRRRWQKRPEA